MLDDGFMQTCTDGLFSSIKKKKYQCLKVAFENILLPPKTYEKQIFKKIEFKKP